MNRGKIAKRNGSWGFRVSYTDDNGQRKWISRNSARWTQKDAQREMVAMLAKIDAGHNLGTSRGTVGEYLTGWLEQYAASGNVKRTTAATTSAHVHAYLVPRIGAMQLRELKPAKIAALYAELLRDGGTGFGGKSKRGDGLSAKTVRNVAGTLHKALSDAVRMGIIASNPAASVERPRWDRPEMQIWDLDQVARFLSRSADDPHNALWRLVLVCGLRRGELLGLRWSDVDLVDGSVAIRQTRVLAGSSVVTDTPKTRKGRRTVAIDAGTVDALARLKDAQEAARDALGGWPTDLVAVDAIGRPIDPKSITRRFQAAARDAGLPVIRLHDGRHTAISEMLRQGVPVHVVAARVGHARPSTTIDTYAHALPQIDRAAADVFGSSLADAMRRHDAHDLRTVAHEMRTVKAEPDATQRASDAAKPKKQKGFANTTKTDESAPPGIRTQNGDR